MKSDQKIIIRDLGIQKYEDCLSTQRQLHAEVCNGTQSGHLLFVEHPPVLTLGKHSNPIFIKATTSFLEKSGVEIIQVERGGEVTAHELGQIVVYPILRLPDHGLMPKQFINLLEDAVITTLEYWGISAHRDQQHPGVWVNKEKICAVGVRIKERTSLHGIALNVSNTLKTFEFITPCGIQDRGVTTIEKILNKTIQIEDAKNILAKNLISLLS